MILATSLFLAAWLGFAGGQAPPQAGQETTVKKDNPKGMTAEASPASQADAEYKIGPQDVLRIDVWKEAEISRTLPVRPDGKISLPLLNDVQATGLTAGCRLRIRTLLPVSQSLSRLGSLQHSGHVVRLAARRGGRSGAGAAR